MINTVSDSNGMKSPVSAADSSLMNRTNWSNLMIKPLKVGLVGAGGVSRAHLPAYREFPERVRLTAICDVREEAARQCASEMGIDAVYTDIEQMLTRADIDAVDICTTHSLHAPLTIAAAEAGKHVLVEKPMACSMAECRAMVEAAEKAEITLMVGQMQRFNPHFRGVRRIIEQGELGPIRAIRIDAMQNGPEALRHNSWLLDGTYAGGGILISVAVHKIDLVRFLVGDIKRVSGICKVAHPAFTNQAEDYAVAVLEFENGAIGDVFGTYSGFRQPWAEMLMIFGDDGVVNVLPNYHERAPVVMASRQRTSPLVEFRDMFTGFIPVEPDLEGLPTENPFTNEILHFADCCASGAEPLSSGRDNLGTMKVVFGIYQSASTGTAVDLADL
jgi:predicted dehydrogenase